MCGEGERGIHVAIIMDGNGRWAERRGLPRVAGRRAGVATVQRVVEHAVDTCISRLTLYAFSSDNWRRPATEVQSIFWLLRAFVRRETERMRQRGVRVKFIGRRDCCAAEANSSGVSSQTRSVRASGLLSHRRSAARCAA